MSAIKHIIGSLGEIGSEVVSEVAKVPGDMAGSLLESVGTPSGKKQGSQQSKGTNSEGQKILDTVSDIHNEQKRRQSARRVLEQYVGYGKPQKEPTVYEKKIMEEEEKKKFEEEEKKKKEKQALPKLSTKQKPGDLYGILSKREGSEIGKNVKAE
jgi:hypothetical protein